MHFCHEEARAIVAAVGGAGMAGLWARMYWARVVAWWKTR